MQVQNKNQGPVPDQKAKLKFNDISQFHYSEYIEIDLGTAKMLVFSGQLALDAEGKTVGLGNFEQQAEHIF